MTREKPFNHLRKIKQPPTKPPNTITHNNTQEIIEHLHEIRKQTIKILNIIEKVL